VRKIHIHYGEYEAQCECCETFRTIPDEIVFSKAILNAVKRLRRTLCRSGNRGRKKKRGCQTQAQRRTRERSGPTFKEQAAFLFKHRYLITKRREKMTTTELEDLETM
jgi:hypothetical protein